MEVTNYDKHSYDYSTYWKNRAYEDIAEKIVLEKLMHNVQGDWFIDIGGSFGRNTPIYSKRFKNCIIGDYSIQTLIKYRKEIKRISPNVELIALNAYYLPFKNNVFDGALLVRVLHHLNNPEQYTKELGRILNINSIYIQEFANKVHIKAAIKNLLKLNFKFFNETPYQQPSQGYNEGNDNDGSIFLNFHPNHIKRLFTQNGLSIVDRVGASYLRIPILKRFVKTEVLISIERLLQLIFKYTYVSPSIFFKAIMRKHGMKSSGYNTLNDILCCPKCNGELLFKDSECLCSKCKKKYIKTKGVWDFRI